MKKLYTALTLILTSFCVYAQEQLPNNDFENWGAFSACTGFDTLTNYTTSDQNYYKSLPFCYAAAGVSKSTDAQSGTYALKLKGTDFFSNPSTSYITFSKLTTGEIKGIPFTSQPNRLTGYYKFNSGSTSDSLIVSVNFSKDGETFGYAYFKTGTTVNTYTKFDLPIEYFPEQSPDSVIVVIQIDDENGGANANTVALIDNLKFEYTNTNIDPDKELHTAVNLVQKEGVIEFSETVSNVKVSDIIGNTVISNHGETRELNINSLSRGVYILSYYYNNKPVSQKIVIN
jgi:hypothetical protein